jgi:hypothetical protein
MLTSLVAAGHVARAMFDLRIDHVRGAILRALGESAAPPAPMSGVAVRTTDADTDSLAKAHDAADKLVPGLGDMQVGAALADSVSLGSQIDHRLGDTSSADPNRWEHMSQSAKQRAADGITDLLQAARGEPPNPHAVDTAMAAAVAKDPEFVEKMWEQLGGDPAREAWANHLLEGTRFHREPKADKPWGGRS